MLTSDLLLMTISPRPSSPVSPFDEDGPFKEKLFPGAILGNKYLLICLIGNGSYSRYDGLLETCRIDDLSPL